MISRSLRYLLVGSYNAGVGYLIFYLINYALGHILHYLAILVISYFLSLTHAYVGQRWVVFRSTAQWKSEYFRFLLVNISGMVGNGLLLVIFVEWGFRLMVAQGISVIIITVCSYFGHRHFSFRTT